MSAVVALYPDAELVALTYLRAALAARSEPYAAGVQVTNLLPPGTDPVRHVRIRRVGGVELHQVADSPRLQVQVWYHTSTPATDEKRRQDLAQLVWALLRDMAGQDVTITSWPTPVTCYRVATLGGPASLPDPANNARVITQLTVEVGMRGRAL